jgi:hypothetical protein
MEAVPASRGRLLPQQAAKVDYALRDGRNRKLGSLGEQFVIELERVRLRSAGRSDLADRVEHSSKIHGDGLGYDVTSYLPDGRVVRIEVKTTRLGPGTPFFMSPKELEYSRSTGEGYRLVRVYNWGLTPRVFELSRERVGRLQTEPAQYRCWL